MKTLEKIPEYVLDDVNQRLVRDGYPRMAYGQLLTAVRTIDDGLTGADPTLRIVRSVVREFRKNLPPPSPITPAPEPDPEPEIPIEDAPMVVRYTSKATPAPPTDDSPAFYSATSGGEVTIRLKGANISQSRAALDFFQQMRDAGVKCTIEVFYA